MTIATHIPQHPLKDNLGNSVDFHFSNWGSKEDNYDFEKPHRHNFYELLFFHKGGGVHDIDFTTYKAQNRSIHFVAPHNVHLVLRSKQSEGCSLLFVNDYLPEKLLSKLPFSKETPVFRPNKNEYTFIRKIIDEIEHEYTNKNQNYQELIHANMQVLLLQIQRMNSNCKPNESIIEKRPEALKQFLELIPIHFESHLGVKQYSEKLNITDKHLIEICKTHTGKTPLKHIREFMISEAKKLLYHTSLSIKEVAYKLNFDDPANFSRFFKSSTGYTPNEYRDGIR
ncbi:MAG: helix-turn-helix domain-containing protein [Bacteroidia bacterium]